MQSFFSRSQRLYLIYTTLFCVLFVLSNIIGTKIFKAPFSNSLALTSSIIIYPLTFVINDLVTEIWGKRQAQFMVKLSFFVSLLVVILIQLVIQLPPHHFWAVPSNPYGYSNSMEYQIALESVLGLNYKFVIGSLIAFLVAQLIDVQIFEYLRKLTNNKHLWFRNNGSTWVAQLVDTFIVSSIVLLWGLHMPMTPTLQLMGTSFLYKIIITLLETPLIYLGVFLTRRYIGGTSNVQVY